MPAGLKQNIYGARTLRPMGYQQITSLSSVQSLTLPAGDLVGALLQAETQNIRFRDDGTNPTAAVGMLLIAGAQPAYYEGDLSALRFIEAVASAKLNVAYYG